MSVVLQSILIMASILTLAYMLRKIRKSHMRTDDAIFWILFSGGLFIISIFPKIPAFCAKLIGIQSASNFIYLAIIFTLLLKQFLMTVKISRIESKLQILVQRLAVEQYDLEEKIKTFENK